MALDKEQALEIAHRKCSIYHHGMNMPYLFSPMHMDDYAKAIYALGVAEERERCALVCESDMHLALRTNQQGVAMGMKVCAEAIRKGE